ncbi:TonB-dependent receptor [Lysobacter niastensis]|uniref:TonB-dependent receptor n=1 Tax=Lysobacter niastensis TaxID=380629 RepID=A0ABS0B6P6_9GAMM|nr:TonB-dependent receptor [Lysobacter niastensis]MBF6022694.1 TonB-dependent receptor [Lysobacter niastensis]
MTNRKFVVSPLAGALTLALSAPALAGPSGEPMQATDLDKVEVIGQSVEKPSSVKYTEPLLNTPQTITVVTKDAMDAQGLLSLRDVLTTLPGITFGAGEGGGGYGDSINLRGFTANSDITTDNVRDSAQYSRTDTFNVEALELVNGSNSVYSGAGSVGGNINLVSKAARSGDSTVLQAGAGTDSYGRLALDSNTEFDNGTAFRINAMVHQNDAPGRDYENFERWGIAPSVAFGLGTDTRFTLSYFHQSDDNIPQYGVPYFSAFGGPLPGADPSNYYGYHNVDTQEIDVDMLTGVFEHDFSSAMTLRSLARFQQVDQLSIVDAPQGTWCLDSGINPATGTACARGSIPGTVALTATGPRGHSRDTRNAIAISQTDLTSRFSTGSIEHALVAGVSFSRESFDLDSGAVLRTADGTPAVLPPMSIANPDSLYTGPYNFFLTGRTEGSLDNQAAYVFDTLQFNDQWMLNLGARYEHNEGDSVTWNIKTYTAPTAANPRPDNSNIGAVLGRNPVANNEDDLFSYRAGLIFKPVENGTIYLSYSNSKTPSKASVNGSCTATSTTGTANCNVDPETAVNYELGTKWDVLDNLAVTAAVFRNERQNYKVADPGNPANPSGEQQLDGEARVDGVSLGVAGRITHDWSVFANFSWLDSEVLQGVSDDCLARPRPACLNTAANPDPLKGLPISATPERSGSIWTAYDWNQWTFGYGITYQSGYEYYTSSTTALINNRGDIKGYTTHRAMIGYEVNERLSLQLNANNLFDKEYYIRVRNNGWATPGDARQVVLSATYRF